MRFEKVNRKMKKITRTAIVCMLTFCMLVVSAATAAPAEAAGYNYKSPFDKKNYSHDSRFRGNLIVNGVDVSEWQSSKSNWSKAKSKGVDYAIMRVTWSGYGRGSLVTKNDDAFATMYKKAKAAGVMCGVYVFSQATNASEATQEAKFAVKRLKKLGIGPGQLELPVYMDYEFAGGRLGRLYGLKSSNATSAAAAFCNTIKSYGYQPGIYASTSFFNSYIDRSKIASDVDIWAAQYYTSNQYGGKYSKWQYTSTAKVEGIYNWTGLWQGNTDVNFWYLNKKANSSPKTTIQGRTTLSVKDAKAINFTIKDKKSGAKLVKGKDYVVGGIRNNRAGNAYAYIRGIGRYGGYALVPLKIAAKSSGSTTAYVKNADCANYLTYASSAKSVTSGGTASKPASYKKGNVYTVNVELNVRKGAGTGKAIVKRSALSSGMKKYFVSGSNAVLKPGTKVKCVSVSGSWIKVAVKVGSTWTNVPGGWVCTGQGGDVYVGK